MITETNAKYYARLISNWVRKAQTKTGLPVTSDMVWDKIKKTHPTLSEGDQDTIFRFVVY